ncbi:HAD domain-containing protein [Streptomyces sp. NPDC059740]|uniref:HAD domain-containing protein n=1 Tax=Streptomyces sp. NPDC059740 TaxID=3346926 RepID=UPI00365DCD70
MPEADRPLLFLDVDGPLNPWRAAPPHPAGYAEYRMRPTGWEAPREALRVWLDPGHGDRLLALGCRLVWATTWQEQANTWIGPVLGLPELPCVHWTAAGTADPHGVHWKTRRLVRWAAGRPFAWVDDEITAPDRSWVLRHHPGPALLYPVDPAVGLVPEDFEALASWAEGTRGAGG